MHAGICSSSFLWSFSLVSSLSISSPQEILKRATNYFNMERLILTHRVLAQGASLIPPIMLLLALPHLAHCSPSLFLSIRPEKREELVKAVHQELEEELQMKKKRTAEELEQQRRATNTERQQRDIVAEVQSVLARRTTRPAPRPPPRTSRAPLPGLPLYSAS